MARGTGGTDTETVFAIATANRLLAADLLEGLSEEQWRAPSLCEGWTVREVAAHLVPPEGGFSRLGLLRDVVRFRGDLGQMVDHDAREGARQSTATLVRQLRERAGERLDPPVVRARGPMTDTAVHLRDIARPLGLATCPEPPTWLPVLDFLVSRPATRGFLPKDRLPGLRLEAADQDWSWGEGRVVTGPVEALAMAISGRPVALPDLVGPGVDLLAARVGR